MVEASLLFVRSVVEESVNANADNFKCSRFVLQNVSRYKVIPCGSIFVGGAATNTIDETDNVSRKNLNSIVGMSSPRSIGGSVREGTRVVLREITASLQNSPPMPPPRCKSGNDGSLQKTAEHEVKVRFAREFADVGSITYSAPESLSSASSFQSLSSSLSTKSSSGICPDSVPQSPNEVADVSYTNSSIPGVEDLILGCADIHLSSEDSYNALQISHELSPDQTFASATDDGPITDITRDIINDISSENPENVPQIVADSPPRSCSPLKRTQDIQDQPIPVVHNAVETEEPTERPVSPNRSNVDLTSNSQNCSPTNVEELLLPHSIVEDSNLNPTIYLSTSKEELKDSQPEEHPLLENTRIEIESLIVEDIPFSIADSATSVSVLVDHVEEPPLPTISTTSLLNLTDCVKLSESDTQEVRDNVKSPLIRSSSPLNDTYEALIVPFQDALKSPGQEIEDKHSGQAESISPSFYNVTNDGESCIVLLNEASFLIPKTPETEENLETDIHKEIESSIILLNDIIPQTPEIEENLETNIHKEIESNNTSNNVKLSPKVESQEADVSLLVRTEVDDNKSDGFLDSKGTDVLDESDLINVVKEIQIEKKEEESFEERLDRTLTFEDTSLNTETVQEIEQYTEFKPQRQSTTLALPTKQPNFDELKSAAEQVADDIFKTTLEFSEESDGFISATSEIFQDPTSFDFLINHGNAKTTNRLRTESLYVKFDPLVANISMLPQGNTSPINEEQNGKTESTPPSINTPKRNPAIAAIDRLLFYSPLSTSMTQKTEEPREKISTEEPKSDTPLVNDINMSKELELVRATVLQLEEELEKQKKEYEAELERQKNSFQEKINKVQAQMAQEVKSKLQMTVVVEEYEKSISRLLTERERDRTNFEQEKAKLQEELQTTNVHLANTEAAFNDVHQKYERLKGVVSAYKNNETVLKESIQENMETIKSLEMRYDQLKNHAMIQLEKANFELDAIRKQHEDETVKLHAMVRKAELKSNSLAELVEQKTKENKELTQILDEVIARVGHQNAE
ncbi:uncharacterized protein LOC143149550 isoform X2 [Ptiloglossa arizonensis]|uniref:uncharacterized protein LOC143149550 isoform X2 n=1 Tax=Ptiloglossa arizonensis TaxID=3350558 RepID=UPI003FA136C0